VKVRVDILGVPMLSEALGSKRIDLEIGGSGMKDLIDALLKRGGDRVRESLFTRQGDFDNTVQIAVNGEKFVSFDDGDVRLEQGDEIIFMMLLGGG